MGAGVVVPVLALLAGLRGARGRAVPAADAGSGGRQPVTDQRPGPGEHHHAAHPVLQRVEGAVVEPPVGDPGGGGVRHGADHCPVTHEHAGGVAVRHAPGRPGPARESAVVVRGHHQHPGGTDVDQPLHGRSAAREVPPHRRPRAERDAERATAGEGHGVVGAVAVHVATPRLRPLGRRGEDGTLVRRAVAVPGGEHERNESASAQATAVPATVVRRRRRRPGHGRRQGRAAWCAVRCVVAMSAPPFPGGRAGGTTGGRPKLSGPQVRQVARARSPPPPRARAAARTSRR